jgi:hypothetical protein
VKAVLGLWFDRARADLQYCKQNDRRRALRIREDRDGKDEDRRYAILAGCPELAASAFWGRSGIGGWVLIRPPDCPNDPTHRTLATDVVGTLACRYSDSSVVIDTATVNPARLIDLPGTRKAKGSPRPERPSCQHVRQRESCLAPGQSVALALDAVR